MTRAQLKVSQHVNLDELLAANQALLAVHVLRDALKQLWWHRHTEQAEAVWQQWYDQTMAGGIAALPRVTVRLRPYLHGTLSCCRHRLNTSVLEGINTTIKVIKRRAYGYRDQDYFFLKIRSACPGIAR